MAQYAEDCAPARTIMVEHDVTFDLYTQLLALEEDWDLRRQLDLWKNFETAAWREVDCVVVMSERDRAAVTSGNAIVIPNGVDLDRFRPPANAPEPGRLLFIGSFAHLPNLLGRRILSSRCLAPPERRPDCISLPGRATNIISAAVK